MAFERVIALSLVALLTACGADKAPDTSAKKAGGEILKGSISDAMLPLDQVRSQPPLAPRSELGGEGKAAAAPKAKSAGTAEPAQPDPEPAPKPENQPEPAKAE